MSCQTALPSPIPGTARDVLPCADRRRAGGFGAHGRWQELSTALELTKIGGFGAKKLLVSLGIASPKQGEGFVLKWRCHFRNDRCERVTNC